MPLPPLQQQQLSMLEAAPSQCHQRVLRPQIILTVLLHGLLYARFSLPPHPVRFLASKHDVVAILCKADCRRPCLQCLLGQQLPGGHLPYTQLTLGGAGQQLVCRARSGCTLSAEQLCCNNLANGNAAQNCERLQACLSASGSVCCMGCEFVLLFSICVLD
jgi:hypothetical protein